MNEPKVESPRGIRVESRPREVWLLGQPPLYTYLKFVEDVAIDSAATPRSRHVEEWRAANDYYAELEETEAGIADEAGISDLDPSLQRLAEEVSADIRFSRSFDSLPTRFAMLELDRLIVGHPYVSENHTDRLMAAFGPTPSPESLFRFCLPLDRSEAPVEVRKTGPRSFMFWSPSSDFRFQEAALLSRSQVPGYEPFGPLGGMVGLLVGYGSNFLNVIRSDGRMLLHNGHHRAYALRDLGITHAPCIVQTVTRLDELKLVAARHVVEDPAFYFAAKRPPLLKDFFDPKIRRVHLVHSLANVVEISFEVKELKKVRDFSAEA